MKLSIIIPTLGRPTLEKVLDGIDKCSRYSEINPEVIVVFNGEGDINEIEEDHCKIYKSPKKGASAARNYGIEKSSGEIIVFIGDDTIPGKSWLGKVHDFHMQNTSQKAVLLGKVSWTPDLAADPLHMWLENHAQFSFEAIGKKGTNWKHFYTSNVSLKRGLIISERFNETFQGWGFEDSEFGYRLSKRGMQISYDPTCEVFHDHRQTFEDVITNTRNARKNAELFEVIHPEVQLLPRGLKKFALRVLILLSYLSNSQETKWWREWKKAWLGKNK